MLLAVALAGSLCATASSAVDQIGLMRDAGIPLEAAKQVIRGTNYLPHEQTWLSGAADIMYIKAPTLDDSARKGMLTLNCGNSQNWREPKVHITVEIYHL